MAYFSAQRDWQRGDHTSDGLYGGNIMGELDTKIEFVLPPPQYPASAILRQPTYKNMIWLQWQNNLMKIQKRKVRLQVSIDASTSDSNQEDLEDQMVKLENKILQAEYDIPVNIWVPLNNEEKGKWETSEKAYGEHAQKYLLNQQKAFAIIIGQSTSTRQDSQRCKLGKSQ